MEKMPHWMCLVALACAIGAANAESTMRSIESPTLMHSASSATAAVAGDASFSVYAELGCRLVHSPLPWPGGDNARPDQLVFVTTADTCGWGAAIGPIWVVYTPDAVSRVVLHVGGYALVPKATRHHALPDLGLVDESAGENRGRVYRFDGAQYETFPP